MIAPDPDSTPHYLENSASGDLLRVRLVPFEFVPWPCWHLKIRVGDLLLYFEKQADGVLVARPDGRQLLIPQDCTRFIGVQPLVGTSWTEANGSERLEG